MFGYVRPLADELKVKEYNTYKAFYCGLCKCSGKCTGCASRFALSYDFVFLALLRVCCTGEKVSFGKGVCMAHPFEKRPYVKRCEALEYCSRAAAILTYYKILDDLSDERGLKRAARLFAKPFAAHAVKKAGEKDLQSAVKAHLEKLSALEGKGESSADAPADIFGRLLSDVGSFGIDGGEGRVAGEVCYHTGKWIYFADILDDLPDDEKEGKYNPLLISYGEQKALARENILGAMAHERKTALAALELLDCDRGAKAILTNILTCGMAAVEKKISEKQNGSI